MRQESFLSSLGERSEVLRHSPSPPNFSAFYSFVQDFLSGTGMLRRRSPRGGSFSSSKGVFLAFTFVR